MAPLPDLIGNEIADLTDFFKRTKNPAAAWRAFSIAQTYTRPIPPEIQAEVDRFAACVSEAVGKAIQIELDLASVTAAEAIKKVKPASKKTDTPKKQRPIVNFSATQLYAAWRNKNDNPVGQLQAEWRDYRIFAAIQTHVDRGVRPGRAREIVEKSEYVTIGADAIQGIWKRLKTKRQRKTS